MSTFKPNFIGKRLIFNHLTNNFVKKEKYYED